MVAGLHQRSTQLVDLINTTKSCQNWEDYPVLLDSPTGSIVSESIIVCGAKHEKKGLIDLSTSTVCYKMSLQEKSWKFLAKMNVTRSGSASASVNGSSLFVTGGYVNSGYGVSIFYSQN